MEFERRSIASALRFKTDAVRPQSIFAGLQLYFARARRHAELGDLTPRVNKTALGNGTNIETPRRIPVLPVPPEDDPKLG